MFSCDLNVPLSPQNSCFFPNFEMTSCCESNARFSSTVCSHHLNISLFLPFLCFGKTVSLPPRSFHSPWSCCRRKSFDVKDFSPTQLCLRNKFWRFILKTSLTSNWPEGKQRNAVVCLHPNYILRCVLGTCDRKSCRLGTNLNTVSRIQATSAACQKRRFLQISSPCEDQLT